MLNLYDRPFVYFPPKPNKFIHYIGRIYNKYYYMPGRKHKVKSVECEGAENIRRLAADKKNRLIFLSNHPSHSDSQVIIEALRQAGVTTNFMAAYDLFFRQSKFNQWVMQKAGSFSVDRESFNSEPIKEAVNILLKGKYHLTLFSEGRPYLQNDLITPFQGGGAFIALSAQKKLDARGKGERVLLVPTAIKLTHNENCRDKILSMLTSLYEFLDIIPDPELKIEGSIEQAASALMEHGLKSLEIAPPKGKTILEQQQYSGEMIVNSLEKEMSIIPEPEKTLNERVTYIRSEIHKVMLAPNGDSKLWALSRIRAQKIMLAMKILSYPLDYLKKNPTLDRCGEIIERLMEDKQSEAIPPYCTRKAIVQFGEAFSLSDIDPSGKMTRNELLSEATKFSQDTVQEMLDGINMTNLYPGGELF